MSIDRLDPVIHAPKRLAVMAVLTHSTSTDFGFLREHLDVSDSDLSKQMSALERAGYVTVSKSSRGRGGVTTYRATRKGAAAYQRHVRALRDIVGAEALSPGRPSPP
jgi:DNA-binding MarR family transcriptional regulator